MYYIKVANFCIECAFTNDEYAQNFSRVLHDKCITHVHSCGMNHLTCDAEFLVRVRLGRINGELPEKTECSVSIINVLSELQNIICSVYEKSCTFSKI